MKKRDSKQLTNLIIIALISFAFYIAFFIIDGYVLCADSNTYVTMSFAREPLYPMYLHFFKIFSSAGDTYLYLAVLVQCLFAAFATTSFALYITRQFSLNKFQMLCITVLPLASSLLCRFAAKRSSMYTNSIMTEGLTISLYLLFMRFGLDYCINQSKKAFYSCCLIVFAAISIRKQMYVLLVLLILITIYTHKISLKTMLRAAVVAIALIGCSVLLDCSYNLVLRGQFTTHKDAGRFPATIAMYAAEEEYSQYIEDDELKQVYLKLYHICDDNEWLMHSAPSDWLGAVSHFGNNYDFIQLDTMEAVLREDIASIEYKKGTATDIERIDMIEKEIRSALLPHEIPKLIVIFINNIFSGLILTIAKQSRLLTIYSALAYLIYIALMVFLIIEARKAEAADQFRIMASAAFGVITLISILGNVGLVSLVIFCQTRYTIYNMSLFYAAGFIMLLEAIRLLKSNRKSVS